MPGWEPTAQRLDGLGLATMVLLGLSGLYAVAGGVLNLQWRALSVRWRDEPWAVTDDELETSDQLSLVYGGILTLLLIATGVVFIVWLFHARRNLNRLRPDPRYSGRLGDNLRLGPGWTIGGWFIPFANMVIPFKVVNGVDQVSRPRPHGGVPVRGTHPVLRWWWAAFTGFWVVYWGAAFYQPETPDQWVTAHGLVAVEFTFLAVAAPLAILVVRRITTHQAHSVAALVAGLYGPSPTAPTWSAAPPGSPADPGGPSW